jgi:hypothetical protein
MVCQRSFTAVAAIELSDDDIAAANIAATTKPDSPGRHVLRDEVRKHAVAAK